MSVKLTNLHARRVLTIQAIIPFSLITLASQRIIFFDVYAKRKKSDKELEAKKVTNYTVSCKHI